MPGGGAAGGTAAKGVFAAVGRFFRDTAKELQAPFQNLRFGGQDLAIAGAGGGTLSGRRFADEMRRWARDSGRVEKGTANGRRNARSKANTSGGKYPDKDAAVAGARKAAAHGGRARFRDSCASDDHVHTDYYNTNGEVIKTEHHEYPPEKGKKDKKK